MQEDIADAVKEENRDNIKFGFSATGSYTSPIYAASKHRKLPRILRDDRIARDAGIARVERRVVEHLPRPISQI